MFWSAFWSNDHAISYLADKHLASKMKSHRERVPSWLWKLGKFGLWFAASITLLTIVGAAFTDPVFAALAIVMMLVYGSVFFGVYRVWQLGSVLSALKNGRSLTTVLSTGIQASEIVDALAARCLREILKWMATPFCLIMVVMGVTVGTLGKGGTEETLSLLFALPLMVLILMFYAVTGAFAVLVVHTGMGHTGARGFSVGFGLLMLSVYGPMLLLLPLALLPYGENAFGLAIMLWFFCLPLTFRKLSIYGLNREPVSTSGKFSLKSLFKGGWAPTLTMNRVPNVFADFNPVLARSLGGLNLLSPLGLLVLVGLFGTYVPAFGAETKGPKWMFVHLLTWVGGGLLSWFSFQTMGAQVSSESQGGRLDTLRSTPLPANKAVDGWAFYSFAGPLLICLPVLAYVLPADSRLSSTVLIALLTAGAAYCNLAMQLDDKISRALCVMATIVFVCSWVIIPFCLEAKLISSYSPLILPTAIFVWLVRDRALKAYR